MDLHAPRYRLLLPLVLALIFLCGRGLLHARTDEDTRGQSFWVSFLENFTSEQNKADLRLYFSSSEVARVTVHYMQTGQSRTITLINPNTVVEMDLDRIFGVETELQGADRVGTEITRRTYHITSDHDITVYGLNLETFSADAFLVYPEDVLDTRYFVLAYPNMPGDTALVRERAYHPSEFCVVGTEDGTTVHIYPQARINGRLDTNPFTIVLDKGDVFFAQAWSRHQDVSGTEIVADHPVAVFGGIARTGIPPSEPDGRDHLVEQMLPVSNWGEEVLLTPFFAPTPESPYNSFARIISMMPGTVWEIDGISQGVLEPGRAVEIEVPRAMRITASNPILVAQYEHSVGVPMMEQNGQRFYRNGDPFMVLAVPSEQFDTAYVFQSISHPDLSLHYINVVIPTPAIGSLRLDYNPVAVPFTPIPGTGFSYGQINLPAGSHTIGADSPFGLYAYGYGGAISYGYVGGMRFRKIVPDYRSRIFCHNLEGEIYDRQVIRDSLVAVELDTSSRNVTVDIDPRWRQDDTLRFKAGLSDPYQDGVVGVLLRFASGRVNRYTESIPGFTLRAVNMGDRGEAELLDTVAVFGMARFCRTITIENYGRFPRRIENLEAIPALGPVIISEMMFPLTLQPGGRVELLVCFEGALDRDTTIRLQLADSCISRIVAVVPLVVGVDTTAPMISLNRLFCDPALEIVVDEGGEFYSGIRELAIDMLKNCTAEIAPFDDTVPVRTASLRLIHDDPREDMIYRITVRDAMGNVRVFADTIGGFTLALPDASGGSRALRLGGEWDAGLMVATSRQCDSIELRNYGLRPLRLETGHLAGNLRFSIPPSQFPLVIPPQSSVYLQVCLDGVLNGLQLDTLTLESGCLVNDRIAMKFDVRALSGQGSDQCGTVVGFTRFGPAKRTFLTVPVPNPITAGTASIDIGLAWDQRVRLDLFDLSGVLVAEILRENELGAGIHRIRLDLPQLPAGEYFCRMVTDRGEMLVEKLVIQE